MGIQVPLMIIDRRGVSIMSTCSRTRRVTHLKFGNASVVWDNLNGETEGCSESRIGSGISQGAPEESGDKVSYIGMWFLGSGKVQELTDIVSGLFLKCSGGSHGGAHYPERPT